MVITDPDHWKEPYFNKGAKYDKIVEMISVINGLGGIGNHASTHEDGGADEISVTDLSGLLADDQHVLDSEVESVITAELVDGESIDLAIDALIATHAALGDEHHAEVHALNSHTQGSNKIFMTKDDVFTEIGLGSDGEYLKSGGEGEDLEWDTPAGSPHAMSTHTDEDTYDIDTTGTFAFGAASQKLNLAGYGIAGTSYDLTHDEISYLDGVTSDIQAQFTGKAASSHAMSTHSDIGSYNINTTGTFQFGAATANLNMAGWGIGGTSYALTHDELAHLDGLTEDVQTHMSHANPHTDVITHLSAANPHTDVITHVASTANPHSVVWTDVNSGHTAAIHEDAGSNEISVAGLSGDLADAQDAKTHSSMHEDGGSGEISVTNLSGLLADAQTPLSHAMSTHSDIGSYNINTTGTFQFGAATANLNLAGWGIGGTSYSLTHDEIAHLDGLTEDVQTHMSHANPHTDVITHLSAANPHTDVITHVASTANPHSVVWTDVNSGHTAAIHEDAGSNEINVGGLQGLLANAQTPTDHSAMHETGGGGEIDVTALSGLLADAQTPAAHSHDSHTGTLSTDEGGTGHASYNIGDILYAGATDTLTKLVSVTEGHVLTCGGANTAPDWEAPSPAAHAMSSHTDEDSYNINTSGTYQFGNAAANLNLYTFSLIGTTFDLSNADLALLDDYAAHQYIGSGNSDWCTCPPMHYDNSGTSTYWIDSGSNGQITNYVTSGTGSNYYIFPMATNKGPLQLYISEMKVGLADADSANCIDAVYIYGMVNRTATQEYTFGTDKYVVGDNTWTPVSALDMGGYDSVIVRIAYKVASQYALDMYPPRLEFYYDT